MIEQALLAGFGGGIATLIAALATVFLSAALRGFAGFGFALTAVPMLSFIMPPSQAVPLASCLQLFAGMLDLPKARLECDWASLRWLLPGAVIGSPLGVAALAIASDREANLAIAVICAVGTAALAQGYTFRVSPRPAMTAGVGLVSGMLSGLAAVPGPPIVAFYLAMPLSPAAIRASLLVFFLGASVVTTIGLAVTGLLTPAFVLPALIGTPLLLAGTAFGRLLFTRFEGRAHRPVSIGLLGLIALAAVLRAVKDYLI
jgi:uncharacterized membrane protein YfcA